VTLAIFLIGTLSTAIRKYGYVYEEPQRHKGHKERPHQETLFAAFLCALCVFVVPADTLQ